MEMREQEHRRGKTPIADLAADWSFSVLAEMIGLTITEMDVIEDAFTILLKCQKKNGGYNTLNANIKRKSYFRH